MTGVLLVTCAAIFVADDLSAQEPWNDFYASRAAQYQLALPDDSPNGFELHKGSLLTYTNPIRRRGQTGSVFAWTQSGRPVFFATIWSITDLNDADVRRTAHESYSLLNKDLSVTCKASEDTKVIESSKLTLMLQPAQTKPFFVDDASVKAPMDSAARRMIQMKRIAAMLSADSFDRSDDRARPLRLMPTPLMRFQSPQSNVIDGAVFALVLTTDPEILVVIEAVKEAKDSDTRWRISPVRFTGTELQLSFHNTEIWRVPKIDIRQQTGPYRLKIGVSKLKSE